MGSFIEINDTLQLTAAQGFPAELDVERHLTTPFRVEDFRGRVFEFSNKDGIRIYHAPPVRNFLVENRDGRWIYWGLVSILEVTHDYANKTTSGKFELLHIYTPDEMKRAHDLLDRREEKRFFV